MAWAKGLHIVSVVFWSASLIYLPMLMAGHSPRLSDPEYLRLHGMVRNLYVWIASPFAILAIVSGTVLIPLREVTAPWFAAKLLFVAALAIIHARCGVILAKQSHSAERANARVRVMRIVLPIVLFPCVLWLVLAKPRLEFAPEPARIAPLDSGADRHPAGTGATTSGAGRAAAIERNSNRCVHRSIEFTPLSRPRVLRTPACRPASPPPKPAAAPGRTIPGPMDRWRPPDRTAA